MESKTKFNWEEWGLRLCWVRTTTQLMFIINVLVVAEHRTSEKVFVNHRVCFFSLGVFNNAAFSLFHAEHAKASKW